MAPARGAAAPGPLAAIFSQNNRGGELGPGDGGKGRTVRRWRCDREMCWTQWRNAGSGERCIGAKSSPPPQASLKSTAAIVPSKVKKVIAGVMIRDEPPACGTKAWLALALQYASLSVQVSN